MIDRTNIRVTRVKPNDLLNLQISTSVSAIHARMVGRAKRTSIDTTAAVDLGSMGRRVNWGEID